MGKNIVICSDGTGSTFDDRVTNVTRLVKSLSLNDHARQVAVYGQGVGTDGARGDAVEAYRKDLTDPCALRITPAPLQSWFPPITWLQRGRGLLTGHGLRETVRGMYRHLAQLYEADDHVFLIGFSRGAFAVRALAGLLYRCHLPCSVGDDFDERFDRAWRLFTQMDEKGQLGPQIELLREDQQPCPVHFLGLWDTVKSYGGLNPIRLPHLRHNPIVRHVRHALALDERRAWFKPTTWGQLSIDQDKAMTRVHDEDRESYRRQDIVELWFTGCHADIGGGGRETATAGIALRWMLGEAVNVTPGLQLNADGWALLREPDPPRPPVVHESWSMAWRLLEHLPRYEIDNNHVWPAKRWARGSDGVRSPETVDRDGKIHVHESVYESVGVEVHHTVRRLPDDRDSSDLEAEPRPGLRVGDPAAERGPRRSGDEDVVRGE